MRVLMVEEGCGRAASQAQTQTYERGHEYDVPEHLGYAFFAAGKAMPALPKPKSMPDVSALDGDISSASSVPNLHYDGFAKHPQKTPLHVVHKKRRTCSHAVSARA